MFQNGCYITGLKPKWLVQYENGQNLQISSARLLMHHINELAKTDIRSSRIFEVMGKKHAEDFSNALQRAGIKRVQCLKTNKEFIVE